MRWSVRYQLLVPLVALLLGIIGVSIWSANSAAQRARQTVASRVSGVVQTLGSAHFPLTAAVLEQMKGLSGADYALTNGSQHLTTTLSEKSIKLPPARFEEASPLGEPVEIAGRAYLVRGIVLQVPHPNAGATLYVLYPEARLQDELRAAAWPLLALGIGCGLCAVVLAIGVGRRFVARLRELDRHTRRIAAGDFRPMAVSERNDELNDLGHAVNDMAERLRELNESMQKSERMRLLGQVSGGLAHQLRNAVAGAKLAVQLHARSCASGDAESLEVARRQLARVEADVARFLDLGRDDVPRQSCHVVELVEEAASLLRPQCRHADVQLCWDPPAADPVVFGDPGRIGHVIVNLLTNAVEAAGPGGQVEVDVEQTNGDSCTIEVWDSGPGPDAAVAERLFQPFVTGKADGIGLGLFVAQQAAEAHGGRLDWRREDGRTCFRVELPMGACIVDETVAAV